MGKGNILNIHRRINEDFEHQRVRRDKGRYAWRGSYPTPLEPLFVSRQQMRAALRKQAKKMGNAH